MAVTNLSARFSSATSSTIRGVMSPVAIVASSASIKSDTDCVPVTPTGITCILELSKTAAACSVCSMFDDRPAEKNTNYSKTCVKLPLKKDKTKILMTNGSLMKVENIVECSPVLT